MRGPSETEEPQGTYHVSQSSAPLFSVVIPVFNALPHLRECLASVQAAMDRTALRIEAIVIDNESTDGSDEVIESAGSSRIRLERFPKRNIASVRNFGAELAAGRYLCFLDSDVLIPTDYFEQALDALQRSGADATGCQVTVPAAATWIETTWAELHRPRGDGWVHYINSANFVVSADAFRAIGGFNPVLTTGEDAEIGQRLCDKGYHIYQSRRVSAIHLRNPRTLRVLPEAAVAWHRRTRHGSEGITGQAGRDDPPACGAERSRNRRAVCSMGTARQRLGVAMVCSLAAPAATVAYRFAMNRVRPPRILGALILYHLYFDARGMTLCRILVAWFATRFRRGGHQSRR